MDDGRWQLKVTHSLHFGVETIEEVVERGDETVRRQNKK
jgi:hypothetical protein